MLLTQVGDTVSDHNTLQVDRGLAVLLEGNVSVGDSRGKDRKVSALHQSAQIAQIAFAHNR